MEGHELYEVGEALVDLNDLNRHMNQVPKVLKPKRRWGTKKTVKTNVTGCVLSRSSQGRIRDSQILTWKVLKGFRV